MQDGRVEVMIEGLEVLDDGMNGLKVRGAHAVRREGKRLETEMKMVMEKRSEKGKGRETVVDGRPAILDVIATNRLKYCIVIVLISSKRALHALFRDSLHLFFAQA